MQTALTAIASVDASSAVYIRFMTTFMLLYAARRNVGFVRDYTHVRYRDMVDSWSVLLAAVSTTATLVVYLLPVSDTIVQVVVSAAALQILVTMVRYGHWLQWNLHLMQIKRVKDVIRYKARVPGHGDTYTTAAAMLSGFIGGLVVYRSFVTAVSAALLPVLYFAVHTIVSLGRVPAITFIPSLRGASSIRH